MHPLRARIQEVSRRALASGHLLPIGTRSSVVSDHGMSFLVRIVESLARKPKPPASGESTGGQLPRNPFLPYEPELFVADLSETHVGLLNKFMVVHDHLLIVTRQFERQTDPLTPADFAALADCLRAYDSLGFYNSGETAGASQPHRHLQLIPLPLEASPSPLPVDELLWRAAPPAGEIFACSDLPFAHRAIGWPERASDDNMWSQQMSDAYGRMIESMGWTAVNAEHPYNLLVTRRGMMLVPREQECFRGISLNAMAFAGALLVRDQAQLDQLIAAGPMQALMAAAGLH